MVERAVFQAARLPPIKARYTWTSSSRRPMANITKITGLISLTNLTAFNPPIPYHPIAPNFILCDGSYGVGLPADEAIFGASTFPQGTNSVAYTVNQDLDSPRFTDLPIYSRYGDVAISVSVAGVADIDFIQLVPNQVRGMATYVADRCLYQRGRGGFMITGIMGLIDYVTDPTSDLDARPYPPSTAFVTVLVSSLGTAFSAPGDRDPGLAHFLVHEELKTFDEVQPQYHEVILARLMRYTAQAARMVRLGDVTWWGFMEPVLHLYKQPVQPRGQLARLVGEAVPEGL